MTRRALLVAGLCSLFMLTAARAAAPAVTFDPAISLDSRLTFSNAEPAVAASGRNAYFTWQDAANLRFRKAARNGAELRPVQTLRSAPTTSGSPTIAARGRTVMVAWLEWVNGEPATGKIQFRRSLDGGATWKPVKTLGASTYAPDALPKLMEEEGIWYLAWSDSGRLMLRTSANRGRTWSPAFEAAFGSHPALWADSKGLYLAYKNVDGEIVLRRSQDAGLSFASEIQVSTGGSQQKFWPAISGDGTRVVVLWTQFAGDFDANILSAVSRNAGATWQRGTVRIGDTGTAPLSIAGAPGHGFHAAWGSTAGLGAFYAASADGRTWAVADRGTRESQHAVAAGGERLFVVYQRSGLKFQAGRWP